MKSYFAYFLALVVILPLALLFLRVRLIEWLKINFASCVITTDTLIGPFLLFCCLSFLPCRFGHFCHFVFNCEGIFATYRELRTFFLLFRFFSFFRFLSIVECVCRACRIRYDDMALHCLLCLRYSNAVVSLCRNFATTGLVSL